MARFEAHITLDREHAEIVEKLAHANDCPRIWTYSQITGCPLLGQGTYCYLTAYDEDADYLMHRMNLIANSLRHFGIEPLRLKIERIIYDTKTNVNELGL